jgi:hypothetical protein
MDCVIFDPVMTKSLGRPISLDAGFPLSRWVFKYDTVHKRVVDMLII